MSSQQENARIFADLHCKGDPVVLFNIWDPGSARAVAAAGAQAIATGSAPVAMAHGFGDGEKIPLETALDNAARIVTATDLPVSLDFEGGYAADPEGVAANAARALETGVVGFNFEDQIVGGEGLYDIPVQAGRIAALRGACGAAGVDAFINARTDIFLKAARDTHSQAMLDAAVERAAAYAAAGASGFFAPGLADEGMIAELCSRVALPVNIIALPGVPDKASLAAAGVARISYGPVPYRGMIKWLEEQARAALE